jgi:hypothetical protein
MTKKNYVSQDIILIISVKCKVYHVYKATRAVRNADEEETQTSSLFGC